MEEKEEGEEQSSDEDGELDEPTQREDRVAKAGLDAIMREYGDELNKELPSNGKGLFFKVLTYFSDYFVSLLCVSCLLNFICCVSIECKYL